MYKIGTIYKEFITNREAILVNLKSELITLKFLWKNPDKHIVENFSEEPFFQLYFKNDIMFLLIKFKDLKWVDVPCFFTKNTKTYFSCDKTQLPCRILLANSNTGLLFLDKTYKMPNGITKAFIQGVHTQKDLAKKVALEKINSTRGAYSAEEMAMLSLGRAK